MAVKGGRSGGGKAPRAVRPTDRYFELVREFPLIHIRDRAHMAAAHAMMTRLLGERRDRGAEQYLDALTDLMEVYENGLDPLPDASEADVLRELMRANGLTQRALAARASIAQSTLSAVLNGTRGLTKEQVAALARLFNVTPAAFFPRP